MATKTGEFREMLIEAVDAVRHHRLDPDDAKAMASLAAQVNLSLQVEINARKEQLTMSRDGTPSPVGSLTLGTEKEVPPEPKKADMIAAKTTSHDRTTRPALDA